MKEIKKLKYVITFIYISFNFFIINCTVKVTIFIKLTCYNFVLILFILSLHIVEVGYSYVYNKYFLQDAYLDLKGNGIFLLEQKHFPRKYRINSDGNTLYFNTVNEAIPLMQKAIEYLENYLNSNWLEQKPVIKNDILNSKYNHYVFEYNGNKYAQIVNSDIAKLFIKDKNSFIEGNELYRIENA